MAGNFKSNAQTYEPQLLNKGKLLRGPLSTMDSVLALHPAAPGWITGIPKNFSEFLMLPRLINGAAA